MQLKLRTTDPLQTKSACLVIGVFADRWHEPLLDKVDALVDGRLQEARRNREFTGKANECLLLQPIAGGLMRSYNFV